MKRFYVLWLSCLVLLGMAGCRGNSAVQENQAMVQMDDQLQQFIELLDSSMVLSFTWEQADDLEVESFIYFYYYMVLLPQNPDGWDEPIQVPRLIFEDYISTYFDVSDEHLHTAKNYDSTGEHYSFAYGTGSGGKFEIKSVTVTNDITSIDYLQYNPADAPMREGEVQLKIADGHYKVLSCRTKEVD